MRRKIGIATAVAMLVFASAAYAALNSYNGSGLSFKHAVGSAKAPAPVAWSETLKAANSTPSSRAAVLVDIKTTVYGLVSDSQDFPSCSSATIERGPKYDGNCPKGSMIGSGPVHALLGGPDLTQPGAACNTFLHVYNAGGGKAWYFFTTKSASDCGGLTTGQTAPYEGTSKRVGKNLVIDVPLPPDVSTAVANHPGLYGSLISEALTFPKLTRKVHGKTVGYFASVGCRKGMRPYTIAFKSTADASHYETDKVSGAAKC